MSPPSATACEFCTVDKENGTILSCTLSPPALRTALAGVSSATKASASTTAEVLALLDQVSTSSGVCSSSTVSLDPGGLINHSNSSVSPSPTLWRTALLSGNLSPTALRLATLLLGVSMLKDLSYHRDQHNQSKSIQEIWTLVHAAITNQCQPRIFSDMQSTTQPMQTLEGENLTFTASRSAQGFLSIALSSIIESGQISELIRLHVWLADDQRGVEELAIHAHQPWAQSWILTGRGTDVSFDVKQIDQSQPQPRHQAQNQPQGCSDANVFQEHVPRWFSEPVSSKTQKDGTESTKTKGTGNEGEYKTHQLSSKVVPNGNFVTAEQAHQESHGIDDTYVVPAGAFHRSIVPGDAVHATLFFFDARRGFVKDAAVLGPREGKEYTQVRGVGAKAGEVAEMVFEKRRAEMDDINRRQDEKCETSEDREQSGRNSNGQDTMDIKADEKDMNKAKEVGMVRYCRNAIYDRWLAVFGNVFAKVKSCDVLGRSV